MEIDIIIIVIILTIWFIPALLICLYLWDNGYSLGIALTLALLWPLRVILYIVAKIGEWLIDPLLH